jgi:hypothetical protein
LRNKAIDRWRAIGSRELFPGQAAGVAIQQASAA